MYIVQRPIFPGKKCKRQVRSIFYFSLLTLSLFTSNAMAQDTENYGAVWTEIGVTKVLPYNFSLEAGVGFRTLDWFEDANRFDASIGLSYKLGKYLKFGLGYTFIERHYWDRPKTHYNRYGIFNGYNIDESHWAQRHRVSFDVTADKRFWKTLRISLRERYQYTHQAARDFTRQRQRDPSFDADGNITGFDEITELPEHKAAWDRHLLRSRLKFAIDRKGLAWEPFTSVEFHNDIGNSWHLDKIRAMAGTEYAVSKQHKVSAAYVFTHENDDDGNENIHAISIGYRFKF